MFSLPEDQSSIGDLGSPMAILSRFGGKHAKHLAVGWAVTQAVRPTVTKIRDQVKSRMTYTITIHGTDEVYPDLHDWVLSLIPATQRRALIAVTGEWKNNRESASVGYPEEDYNEPTPVRGPEVRLRYDGSRKQGVTLGGHKVTVEVNREEGKWNDRLPENWRQLLESIVFTAKNPSGRDAVVRHIDQLLENRRKKPGPPPLRISDRWGSSWDKRDDLPLRSIDSIVLKKGQMERLVGDLGEFLKSESEYNRRQLPYHRGYLFTGPPGTGKTSVAKALANYFEMPVYYLPLSDIKDDGSLISLVGCVKPRSMLLLEDVDVCHAATERDDEGQGVSLSSLLNALDGLWTPHGLVVCMTTNHRDALDAALLRAGRVDREEEFTTLDVPQGRELMRWFYGSESVTSYPPAKNLLGKSPADLIEVMWRHKDDPMAAVRALSVTTSS